MIILSSFVKTLFWKEKENFHTDNNVTTLKAVAFY